MGEHICLCEWAAVGSELGAKLIEESKVDVDVLVGRTVERADSFGGCPAAGLDLAGKEGGLGELVAARGELVLPVALNAVHKANNSAIPAAVCIRACLALVRELARVADRLVIERPVRIRGCPGQRVYAQQPRYPQDDQPQTPPPHRHTAARNPGDAA